jgi:acetyltransferase-like isoleucine patch superfamily enzyme
MRAITRDAMPHLVDSALSLARLRINFFLTSLLARWWGVHVPASCTFHGLPVLRRHPESSIRIGERCSFRSANENAFFGFNHPCILCTRSENARIEIGDDCGFSGVAIVAAESITIGRNVKVEANATILDYDGHNEDPRSGPARPIVIEDDVWLGMNTMILKGVRIGKGSLIAASSVVTRSIPPGVLASGNPAKPILSLAMLGAGEELPVKTA